MKEYIQGIIRTSKFDPKFTPVTNIHQTADFINRPHEDYPDRVAVTDEMIQLLLDYLNPDTSYTGDNVIRITESEVLHIHNKVMPELYVESSEHKYRRILVHPNGGSKDTYFDPIQIQDGMNQLLPINLEEIKTPQELIDWYHAFQIIHPFKDGNGRVGGIVVAAVSKLLFGKFLAPHQ